MSWTFTRKWTIKPLRDVIDQEPPDNGDLSLGSDDFTAGTITASDTGVSTFNGGILVYGFSLSLISTNGAYTIASADDIILCNGTFSVTLPASVNLTGKMYEIKNIGTGVITVDGNGAEVIDGNTTIELAQYDGASLACNGTGWYLV